MADIPLGKVTTSAGVRVRLTSALADPAKLALCHSYMVEVLPTNTGKVYIGDSQLVGATMFHVIAWLPVPTKNSAPSYTATVSSAPNALQVTDRYLDVEVDGDGVTVAVAIN